MKKRSDVIIAETLGWDFRDVQEHRYQKYVNPIVYALGNRYFAVHKTKPKHSDVSNVEWIEYKDQFGARDTDRKIWVCDAT